MALFTADVLAGAFFRAAFMSDVAEALVLAISCCFFVVGILSLEGQQSDDESMTIQMGRRKPDDRQENPGRSGFDREAQFSQADWRRCIYRCHGGRRCGHIVV
jgi:hypothetical protein